MAKRSANRTTASGPGSTPDKPEAPTPPAPPAPPENPIASEQTEESGPLKFPVPGDGLIEFPQWIADERYAVYIQRQNAVGNWIHDGIEEFDDKVEAELFMEGMTGDQRMFLAIRGPWMKRVETIQSSIIPEGQS